jgi:hypothetical protein
MAFTPFRVRLGVSVDDQVWLLATSGVPSGTVFDDAPKGSLAADYTNGVLFQKTAAGTGSDKWSTQASQLTASNREPVRVVDTNTWATLSAAETELNDTVTPGSLGGVDVDQFADGDRILLTDLTTGNENVYVVTGTPGSAATLTEDGNSATDGDALWVQEGTNGDQQWFYDGSAWQHSLSGVLTQITNLTTFTGGTGTPDHGAGTSYISPRIVF